MERRTPYYPYDDETDRILFDDEMNVSSSCECTGLTPTPPLDEEEARSYSTVYDIPLSSQPCKSHRRNSTDSK